VVLASRDRGTAHSEISAERRRLHANAFNVSLAVSAPATMAAETAAKAAVTVGTVAADVIALGVRILRRILNGPRRVVDLNIPGQRAVGRQ
jgi:hypothetical protein